MTKSHFQQVTALWMFSWEPSAMSEGSCTFGKLYFKVATLNRAILFHYYTDFFWCSEEQGDYCGVLL